jgi:hypothetical protein
MAVECFIPRDFTYKNRTVIRQANEIIDEYQEQGFSLTLRQLYYQFVSRDILPNNQRSYDRLGTIINNARLAGLIDWDAIEDRTRYLRDYDTKVSPEDAIRDTERYYIEDLWASQDVHVEVWIEKDALVGVIEPVCRRWRLPYYACRGYSSQSEQYKAGKRLQDAIDNGKQAIILHLGDHDPSGIDMSRDNLDRLDMFAERPGELELRRLALNYDQIKRYNPPPNPAKDSDSRAKDYKERFGNSSWELDALDPKVIDKIIEDEINSLVDREKWDRDAGLERDNRAKLREIADRWPDVTKFLADRDRNERIVRLITERLDDEISGPDGPTLHGFAADIRDIINDE